MDEVNGAVQPPGIRHEFTDNERALVEAIQRDMQALNQQMFGALRHFAIERKVRGSLRLADDMTHLIEIPQP